MDSSPLRECLDVITPATMPIHWKLKPASGSVAKRLRPLSVLISYQTFSFSLLHLGVGGNCAVATTYLIDLISKTPSARSDAIMQPKK